MAAGVSLQEDDDNDYLETDHDLPIGDGVDDCRELNIPQILQPWSDDILLISGGFFGVNK